MCIFDAGRHAESPVLMLKLEYLRYHHNVSDREVIARSVTDLAVRNFLRIPLRGYLPDPSTLCVFRGRLGREGFRNIFTRVVQIAREYGVVKDRLRIKDATHVIGNIAVPSTLALVAQIRDKLLSAAAPFAPRMVEGERVNLELLREATKGLNPKEKLVTRVAQLRENLGRISQPTRRTTFPLLGHPQSVYPGGDGLYGHEHQTPGAINLRADRRGLWLRADSEP